MYVTGKAGKSEEYNGYRQNAADSLTEKGCPCDTGNAHMEGLHKPDVHADVGEGGDSQKVKGRLGISQRGENTGGDIVKEHKGQSPCIDVQIELGVGKHLVGSADQFKQHAGAGDADHHQDKAHHGAENAGGVNSGFHPSVILGIL